MPFLNLHISGTIIGIVNAVDRDEGRHGEIMYAVAVNHAVEVAERTGEVVVGKNFGNIRSANELEIVAFGTQILANDSELPDR